MDAIAAPLPRTGGILSTATCFQPRKIEQSGLWAAVEGRVLIYIHKEEMLDDVEQRYPARRYVMVDDKVRILAAMKAVWRDRLTTVFVRQGHYAHDAALVANYPAADITGNTWRRDHPVGRPFRRPQIL